MEEKVVEKEILFRSQIVKCDELKSVMELYEQDITHRGAERSYPRARQSSDQRQHRARQEVRQVDLVALHVHRDIIDVDHEGHQSMLRPD